MDFSRYWHSEIIPRQLTNTASPTMAADFSNQSQTPGKLLIGNEAGEICLFDSHCFCKNRRVAPDLLIKFDEVVWDVVWGPENKKIVSAVADNFVHIHDSQTLQSLTRLFFNDTSIRQIKFLPKGSSSVLATGGRDGSLCLWDMREAGFGNKNTNKPVSIISNTHMIPDSSLKTRKRNNIPTSISSISSIIPISSNIIATVGQPDYAIRIWDTRYTGTTSNGKKSIKPAFQISPPAQPGRRSRAFVSLSLSHDGALLYAVSSDNNIYTFLTSSYCSTPVATYTAPNFRTSGSFYIRSALSPDDRFLLCGSIEESAFLWGLDDCTRSFNSKSYYPRNIATYPTAMENSLDYYSTNVEGLENQCPLGTSVRPKLPVADSRKVYTLGEHRFEVSCVAWSKSPNCRSPDDQQFIFVGGEDYVSRVWNNCSYCLDHKEASLVVKPKSVSGLSRSKPQSPIHASWFKEIHAADCRRENSAIKIFKENIFSSSNDQIKMKESIIKRVPMQSIFSNSILTQVPLTGLSCQSESTLTTPVRKKRQTNIQSFFSSPLSRKS